MLGIPWQLITLSVCDCFQLAERARFLNVELTEEKSKNTSGLVVLKVHITRKLESRYRRRRPCQGDANHISFLRTLLVGLKNTTIQEVGELMFI